MKYKIKQEIYDFLQEKNIPFDEAAPILGFNSRQALYAWITSSGRSRGLEILDAFTTLKETYEQN